MNFENSTTSGIDLIHTPVEESGTGWLMVLGSCDPDASVGIPASWSTRFWGHACSERPRFALQHSVKQICCQSYPNKARPRSNW